MTSVGYGCRIGGLQIGEPDRLPGHDYAERFAFAGVYNGQYLALPFDSAGRRRRRTTLMPKRFAGVWTRCIVKITGHVTKNFVHAKANVVNC